jgi:ABC-2 type transport system permease protein
MRLFKDLYNYRELLKTSVKKDIGGKYKHSFLGVLWSFINPLLQIAVYAIIFPLIIRNSIENYTVFMVCGLIPWNFFSTVINRSTWAIVQNDNIIKKVFFPRAILPFSLVISETVNFLISSIIMFVFTLAYGMGISKFVLLYPVIIIIQDVLMIGIGFILSAVTVYMRDIQHFIGVILQLMMYATPVVYSIETIPERYRFILRYNPMTYIIEGYRDILYYQKMPDMRILGIIFGIGVVLSIVGYLLFQKLQKRFAEEL